MRGPKPTINPRNREKFIEDVKLALYASKIISYAQGYMLLREASEEYKWKLNYGAIALMWRGGCIIRSRFLGDIKTAFDKKKRLPTCCSTHSSRKKSVAAKNRGVMLSLPQPKPVFRVPCFSTALSFYDGYRRERLPANLLQAQRDYFGAHTYERIDKERGEFFHTNWTGRGGDVSSRTYNV